MKALTCLAIFMCALISVQSLSKRDKKLLKFKKEVDKIGTDLENFTFDIAKEVVRKSDFDSYPEYDYEDDNEEDYATKEDHPAKNSAPNETEYTHNNKIVKEKKHNIDSTTTSVHHNTNKAENQTKPSTKVNEPRKTRTKRSLSNDPTELSENSMHESTVEVTNNKDCYQKTLEESLLERQDIEDLKREVNHLHELVIILKDQQKILTELEKERNSESTQRFNPKDLLKVLEHLNKDIMDKDRETTSYSTHSELEKIKSDLRTAILALDKTKNVVVEDRKKEIALEMELDRQKVELDLLKSKIERMYRNNTELPKAENETLIVGSPQHLPKAMPVLKLEDNMSEGAQKQLQQKTPEARESIDDPRRQVASQKRRASDLEDLTRLLRGMDKPKKPDLESKIAELQEELEKNSKEEKMKQQLQMLTKLLAKEKQPIAPKTLSSDEDEVKKLQLLVQLLSKPQGKTEDDSDVNDELRKLQRAIENLRPKEQSSGLGIESFQDIFGAPQASTGTKLTQQQLVDMRKKLDQMIRPRPTALNIDTKNIPPPYPLWPGNYRNMWQYDNFPGPNAHGYDRGQYGPEQNTPYSFQQQPGFEDSRYYPENNPYGRDFWENRYRQTEDPVKNRFFPAPYQVPEDSGKGDKGPATTHALPDYQTKDVEELKVQIEALEKVIEGLSYSNYGKGPEDQETVTNLEKQIYDLKAIVNNLNQETPLPLPTYTQHPSSFSPPQPNHNQPPPSYNQPQSTYNQPLPSYNQPLSSYKQQPASFSQYPPSSNQPQPISSFNQPPSSYNQRPASFNQPPSSYNQPSGNHEATIDQPQKPYENHRVTKRSSGPLPMSSFNQLPSSYNQRPSSFNQPPGNHEATMDQPQELYENHRVTKSSTGPDNSSANAKLLDDVYNELKSYLQEDDQASQRSNYEDPEARKISNLKAQ
ncbi:unnamed protein product [Phaedon cochleariae]|nr:unnamed protein product [Phaedon cochleariae]